MILGCAGTAHAAVEIDQENLAVWRSGTRIAGSLLHYQPEFAVSRLGQLQSVTAGKEGFLKSIDLQLFRTNDSNPNLSFDVSIVNGEPALTGAIVPLATVSLLRSSLPTAVAVQSGVLVNVDFSSLNYALKAGQKFSILISMPAIATGSGSPTINGPSWAYGLERTSDGSFTPEFTNYSGGFNTVINGDGSRAITGSDRGFRTYVDVTAVPEPATWTMMTGGFGMVGGAIRAGRRRKVTFAHA